MNAKNKMIVGACLSLAMLSLMGCTAEKEQGAVSEKYPEWDNRVVYVAQFGENADDSDQFIFDSTVDNNMHTALQAYDISTGNTRQIFKVNNPENEHIASLFTQQDDIYFSISHDGRWVYYRCDPSAGTVEQADDFQSLYQDNGRTTYATIDTPEYGTITFKKVYDENVYRYKDGDEFIEIPELRDKAFKQSGIFSYHLTYLNGKIYGVITAEKSRMVIAEPSYDATITVIKDVLFSFDPTTHQCEKIYETDNKYTRIVAITGQSIYLYKNGTLSKADYDGENVELICNLDVENVTFSTLGSTLVVYDPKKERVVETISLE